jgi:hypothetical protein
MRDPLYQTPDDLDQLDLDQLDQQVQHPAENVVAPALEPQPAPVAPAAPAPAPFAVHPPPPPPPRAASPMQDLYATLLAKYGQPGPDAEMEAAQAQDLRQANLDRMTNGINAGLSSAAGMAGPAPVATPSVAEQVAARRKALMDKFGLLDKAADNERQQQQMEYQHQRDQLLDDRARQALATQAKQRADFMALQKAKALGPDGNAEAIAEAIIRGEASPMLNTYGRGMSQAIGAILARRGFDHPRALLEWQAEVSKVKALNTGPQVSMGQLIDSVPHQLDMIDELHREWTKLAPVGPYKVWNKASMEWAKQQGGELGAIAHALEAQVADLTAELSGIYAKGGSPTDKALELAAHNLNAAWDDASFKKALGLIRTNVLIRKDARLASPTGGFAGGTTRYDTTPPGQPRAAPAGHGAAPATPASHPPKGTVVKGETLGWDVGTEATSNGDGTYTRTK